MAKRNAATKAARKAAAPTEKRVYLKQTDFPSVNLQQAQKVAAALADNYGNSGSAPPPDVALALNISPTSSVWRVLTGAAAAYGLTDGGYNAEVIKLLPLGRRLVAPEAEGEDIAARREAILKPRILREWFEKYTRAKFPSDVIAMNVLKGMSIPADGAETALQIIKDNGRYAGIIRDTATGPFVTLDSPGVPAPAATPPIVEGHEWAENRQPAGKPPAAPAAVADGAPPPGYDAAKANRVFISHGKQKAIVAQIKEILEYGNFTPVVSVEREATAIPVPEKVFEDMRSCAAGVIHVGSEGKYVDQDGDEHAKLNDNVLIEIGAAMALYGKKVILLVERGVKLPSNLQGLYRCDFDGNRLEHEATMKLLKTFTQFR